MTEPGPTLRPEEIARYGRHLVLPEVGPAGQRRLRAARVLVVGLGGLGSPAALYLAAAGVGVIGLADFDKVQLSNLQRQVLFDTEAIGRSKAEAARDRLARLNPEVELRLHDERLSRANALELVRDYEVVLDASDNFPTRYLVNDACVIAGRPDVFGSVYRFEGQLSVFDGRRGPCYRCLFPEPPPPEAVPSCADGGVLGALTGIVGTLQATEALKILLGIGSPLVGRLLLLDALDLRFRELTLAKNAACPVCSASPTQTTLIDYEAFCGRASEVGAAPTISTSDLAPRLAREDAPLLVDVRTVEEYQLGHLPTALSLPLAELPDRLGELDGTRELVVYCSGSTRAQQACRRLGDVGFTRLRRLAGGSEAWAEEGRPLETSPARP